MQIKNAVYKVKGMRRDDSYSSFNPEYSWYNKNIRLTARGGNDSLSVTNEIGNVKLLLINKTPEPMYDVDIATIAATNILYQFATVGSVVHSDTPEVVLNKGICWSKGTEPTINDSNTSAGAGNGTISYTIHSLDPGTRYYYRAYAAIPNDILYGNVLWFKTVDAIAPIIETKSISNILPTTVTSGGTIIDYGGEIPTIGLCYSLSPNPTIDDNVLGNPVYENSFTITISGLTVDTEYNIRAFAYNSVGVSYGENVQFRTLFPNDITDGIGPLDLRDVTESSVVAESNAYPLILDTSLISDKGACWSTNQWPTISDSSISGGEFYGSYNFITNITNLSSNTKYFVRTYMLYDDEYIYGIQDSITTRYQFSDDISSFSAGDITSSSAVVGGYTSIDPVTIVEVGVVYNTTNNPTKDDSPYISGTIEAEGTWVVGMSPLSSNTEYFYRAYVTTISNETLYGDILTLVTLI